MRRRLILGALLLPLAVTATPAGAQEAITTPCVEVSNPPTGVTDTNWSVRRCDTPDFDQVRAAAADTGSPTPVTVQGLPGDGGCHCVLTSIADLYARARVALEDTAGFATFDWNGRGALPAAGFPYDTTTYTDTEVAAYNGTTAVLKRFGDVADVSYGQDEAHTGCGTSWFALYTKLPQLVETFGETADDYAFNESGIDASSAVDMARALTAGTGVAFAYGYYDGRVKGADAKPDTATKRAGGHANALVGITRSGDTYTFESSDPASSSETGDEDRRRQSAFTRTTWTVTRADLKVGDGGVAQLFNFGDTSRYLDSWIRFGTPRVVLRPELTRVRLRQLVPDLDRPRPGPVEKDDFRFPGRVLDATFDMTTSRVLAIVTVRGRPALYAGDVITGKVSRLSTALPAGADRLATLAGGSVGVLGTAAVRVLGRSGAVTATRTVTGGAADLAFDGGTGGVIVLRADGKRVLRYSATLAPKGVRVVSLPAGAGPAASTGRLTVAADGTTRVSRVPAGTSTAGTVTLATPSGARLVVRNGTATVLGAAGSVPGRSIGGLHGVTVLDLAGGTVSRRPPAGVALTALVDGPAPGYAEASSPPAPDPGGGPGEGGVPGRR